MSISAMNKPLIIYHAGCIDGFTSAFVAWLKFGDEAEYFPAFYGMAPPDVMYRDVYIIDFSYNLKAMEKIISYANAVVVLDHHKTAEAALGELRQLNGDTPLGKIHIEFDMNRSGAGMAWDYFFPKSIRPYLVSYVEDRDIWTWKLHDSKEINAFISTFTFDFLEYNKLLNFLDSYNGLEDAAKFGAVLLKKIDQINEAARKRHMFKVDWIPVGKLIAYDIMFLQTPFVNAPYTGISELLQYIMDKENTNIAVGFSYNNQGMWQYSLRSKGDVDVSEIAKLYGGGGHKHAAGFESDGLIISVPVNPIVSR